MSHRASTITGPLHAHGVRTPEAYLEQQAAHLRALQQARPAFNWGDPGISAVVVVPYISGGRWVVDCPCGNGPSADPIWRLACCFECGAIYRDLIFPCERARLESLLLQRSPQHRHWRPPETVADLERENREHGLSMDGVN